MSTLIDDASYTVRDAELPIIDLRGDGAVAAIREACVQHGFFYVTGHGVDQTTIDAMFRESRRFFTQPLSEKEKVLASEANSNRGYTRMGDETLDVANQTEGDTKEGYYLGREPVDAAEAAIHPMMAMNVYPQLPGWRTAMQAYEDAMVEAGRRVVRAVCEGMGVETDAFMKLFARPVATTRLLRYDTRRSSPRSGVLGCGAHSDYGMVTLLAVEAGSAGLEVLLDGKWLRVPCVPGAFVVNLGDMLQRWTNDTYKSTVHRVVNRRGEERFSTAFFFDPAYDTSVAVLPQFCSAEKPARYEPIAFVDHILAKYRATTEYYTDEGGASSKGTKATKAKAQPSKL